MSVKVRRRALQLAMTLLQEYPEWVKTRNTLDRWIEGIVTAGGASETGPIQGGLPKYMQERLLERKEADPEYRRLARNIERMERVFSGLSERDRFLVEMHCWKGSPWWELGPVLDCSKSELYRSLDGIAGRVAEEWGL